MQIISVAPAMIEIEDTANPAQLKPVVEIDLPWPNPLLNPNRHVRWEAKQNPKAAAREFAYAMAIDENYKGSRQKAYALTASFFPPTRRRYDLDNLLASMKSAIDGLCRAWGIDDRQIVRMTTEWGGFTESGLTGTAGIVTVKNGMVSITLLEVCDEPV